ncbi:hypothetical protein [Egibacter rhizosphaerae]|uniref:hypothetical protein n=1 Tax=Egibacter rhizosphaerae TaxID=1670831 RepID=UPI00197ABF65|nr:hypothetical protein [Egibacter rhizosphaerae]
MSFFDRFRRRQRGSEGPQTAGPSAQAVSDLKEFLGSRRGVEAYVEPPTAVYAMTLVLVAGDGEYIRRPVKHAKQAHQIADDAGIPIYDARIVGYPQRMRDYDRGVRRDPIALDDLPPLETTDEAEAGRDDGADPPPAER